MHETLLKTLKGLDPVDPIVDPDKIALLADEFVCPGCHLALHRSRKHPRFLLCLDCVSDFYSRLHPGIRGYYEAIAREALAA